MWAHLSTNDIMSFIMQFKKIQSTRFVRNLIGNILCEFYEDDVITMMSFVSILSGDIALALVVVTSI